MHIIFGHVSYWQVSILRLLKYFKFEVFYLYINAKTEIKKNDIATKLKNKNIYPLPLELEKKIFIKSNYFINDPQEFTYKKNVKLVPDKIIGKYCELFSINENKKIKLRLLLQDFVGNKQHTVGSLLATWSVLYEAKKILYLSFKFNCFYVPDTGKNILKIIIPLDFFYYLTPNLKKILLNFLSLIKQINKKHKNRIFDSQSFKEFEKKSVAFIVHKGLTYGTQRNVIFEKKLYYSDDNNSCLNKYNILHLDYENFPSADKNLNWLCLKKIKVSETKIFLKTLLACIKTCYLIQNWSKFLGWILCIKQYNNYLKYCEIITKLKNLKLALIDYEDLCPKTLLLALEKNNIKTIAAQERFITTFRSILFNTTLDTYFVASEYVANYMEKSKKLISVDNIIPTGQYRCDYISLYKKKIVPKEISSAKEHGKKIIIALGYHTSKKWFESYIDPYVNWSAHIIFLEDIINLSKLLNNTFIILRYKVLNWMTNSYFKEILNKINTCENVIISDNYKKANYAYKLCANADLIIAKHTSLADECLASEIPVLFHEYTHNTKNYIPDTFDYLSSKLVCHNFDDLLERSKSLLFNNSSQLKNEILTLNKTVYNVKEKGNIKNKIIKHLENLISERKSNQVN